MNSAHDFRPRHGEWTRRQCLRAMASGWAAASFAGCAAPHLAPMLPNDELDELFSDLEDQSHTVQPIQPHEYATRRDRFGALLAEHGFDGILVEPGATLRWLTGVEWGRSERLFGLVLTADGASRWIAPAFEAARARELLAKQGLPEAEVRPWDEHEYAYSPLAQLLREQGVGRLGVDPAIRHFHVERLRSAAAGDAAIASLCIESAGAVVRVARGSKDARELEILRRASELTQLAIRAVSERMRPDMTGIELGRWMKRAQERLGLTGTWVLPLIGPEAAMPHGKGGHTPLRRGSVVLVDTGGALHGYQSDTTRTWVFDGPPTVEVEDVWNAVRDAQRRAFEAIRPGALCRDADRAARAAIEAAGYGTGYESFFHRVGHGIGVEGHEDPYLDGGSEVVLEPGMTFSDEPGIYLFDRFGVRIEDIVVVTDDGADHFGTWQRSPLSPA